MDSARGAPVPLRGLGVELIPRSPVQRVRLLKAGRVPELTAGPDGSVRCVVPELMNYEIVLFVQ